MRYPPPPPTPVLLIKKKVWKRFFINKVFENVFVAANKGLLLTMVVLKFFICNQPLFTTNFKDFPISLIYYYFL